MSGIQNLGGALSSAGSVFGAAGVPFAPVLAGVGGLIGSVFGADTDPFVPNPLPWDSNPYAPQGILWGLPVHSEDVAAWAGSLPVQGGTSWAPAVPGAPPGAPTWLAEHAARGGFKGFDLTPLAETRVLHQHPSGTPTTPPAVGGPFGARYSSVKAHGAAFAQPWGNWGAQLDNPQLFIQPRIERVLEQWEAVNGTTFEPVFWDVDYRTWPQYLRAEFAKQPLQTINQFCLQAGGDVELAGELWYAAQPNGAWTAWYTINQAMPALHLEKTQDWLAWRAQLALEAQLAQSIQDAQDAATAQVLEQYTNALDPATDPTPPTPPSPTPVEPSNPIPPNTPTLPALTSSLAPGPIGNGAGSGGTVIVPQTEQGTGPAPLVLGGLAALALLIA